MNPLLSALGEAELKHKSPACIVLKRPSVSIDLLPDRLFKNINKNNAPTFFVNEMMREAEISIKYKGYIDRQLREIISLKKSRK